MRPYIALLGSVAVAVADTFTSLIRRLLTNISKILLLLLLLTSMLTLLTTTTTTTNITTTTTPTMSLHIAESHLVDLSASV